MTSLNRAIDRFDFESFLQNHGVDVSLKGDMISGICPFCQHKRVSFRVEPEKGLWICHFCGESGGGVSLVRKVGEMSMTKAVEYITRNFTAAYDEDEEFIDDEDMVTEYRLPETDTIPLPDEFRLLYTERIESIGARPYIKYASKRHLDEEICRRYSIGYCATGYFAGRLVVPVQSFGTVVSFVARAIRKSAVQKVLTPKGNRQSRYLFNMDTVWGRPSVVITEGVFDALAIPDKAVATFGKKIYNAQINLLRKSGCEELIFAWDEDAIPEAIKAAQRCSPFFETKLVKMPFGEDPSSLGEKYMNKLLKTATKIDPLELLQDEL